ncbi:MAG: sugar phosphate isomerase/epimerase [Bacteroidales bacterium]|nr:sugar phosphate isomerase/epimerase [Bacteroidales bacterium]
MKKSAISRRKFLEAGASAVILASVPSSFSFAIKHQSKKPDSKVSGVQLGCTTYSYRAMPHKVDDVIQYLLLAGISSIELRSVAEEDLGIPELPARPAGGALSDAEKAEFEAATRKARETQRQWRLSLPMQRYADMRKKFNDAGINIHIAKFAPATWSDEEIDYAFRATKVLGAYGITDEIGEEACRRLGKFAEKHNSLAIFHQHAQPAEPGFSFEKFLSYSPANRLNFDAGHYFGATGLHPNGILEKLHDRICSIHIKDKTGPKSNPPDTNMPFGQGETPIADILLLLKKEKWPINVDIELEYRIPEGSDPAKEVAKCIEYMRNILE